MGSSCSSAQKKNNHKKSPDSPRRLSTESIPYGPPADCSSPPIPEPTPPPTQVQSPTIKEVQTKVEDEASIFPEHVGALLFGKIVEQQELFPRPKEFSLYICADYVENKLEMQALYERVYPPLWAHCTKRGYDMTVVNPHWGSGDYMDNLSQLCLETIAGMKTKRHVLGLVLLHDSIGCFRPFSIVEAGDVNKTVLEDEVFKKWYIASNNKYLLLPFWKHFTNLRTEELASKWLEESDNLMKLFKANMDETKYSHYLSSDLECEIKAVVTDDQNQARNCIWAQRRFTHLPSGEKPPRDDKRLDQVKQYLKDRLPDSQKLVFYAKWHSDGLHLPEHSQYLQELCDTIHEELIKMIDMLMEEDTIEAAQQEFIGIEPNLYNELCQQTSSRILYQNNTFERTDIEGQVKSFLESKIRSPLILSGKEGSGKTFLSMRIAELCATWFPESALVFRVVGLTPESSSQEQLIRSICEQCCSLCGEHPSCAFESIEKLGEILEKLLEKVTSKRSLIILIDGIDQVNSFSTRTLDWLPAELPDKVCLILTMTTDSLEYGMAKKVVKNEKSFIEIPSVDPKVSKTILKTILDKKEVVLADSIMTRIVEKVPNPRSAELTAYAVAKWPGELEKIESILDKNNNKILIKYLIDLCSSAIGETIVRYMLALLHSSRQGLSDKETLDLVKNCANNSWLINERCPYSLWALFIDYLNPFFKGRIVGTRFLISWSGNAFKSVVSEYLGTNLELKTVLVNYFRDMPFMFDIHPNKRKLDEAQLNRDELLDSEWLFHKVRGSDPYSILEEIRLITNNHTDNDLTILSQVIQSSSYALRHDGSQWYSQLYLRLQSWRSKSPSTDQTHPSICALFDRASKPPITSFLMLDPDILTTSSEGSSFDQLFTIRSNPNYVISLNQTSGEIIVWSVYERIPVRTLQGIVEPRDVKLLEECKALVLCNRELKLYDLDKGTMVVRLKGVMNQKMAYYGLHDQHYVVALSRNRMYVNMLNLDTGELETTFKVGEDRFLNSLLVSVNGRICVCGDETQKPFPLLVWDLSSRKLVYDLRIPHHEFITRLAAISDDGHYVVSVCRELHDNSPSFIIVYDLQSGTLFKKWKPESNSCSIAISSQGSCVINGLMNSWLLVWDLSTGVRRHTLIGHSAPVDQIRISESGSRCASFDSMARDRSIRVWDIVKGFCEAVFTPDQPIICCQLTIDGHAIVLGLKGTANLVTLILCKDKSASDEVPSKIQPYGDAEKKGQVFDLKQEE